MAAPFEQRGARTDEYLQVMRSLWTDEPSSFEGEHYDAAASAGCTRSRCSTPHPPIHVGGESNAALRRVARHGQGWYSFNRLPDDLDEPLARLDALLAGEGRTASDIELTVSPTSSPIDAAAVEGYRERGVDRLVVLCLAFDVDVLTTSSTISPPTSSSRPVADRVSEPLRPQLAGPPSGGRRGLSSLAVVVEPAQALPVGLGGLAAGLVGDDVVDLAPVEGHVARRVLAAAVVDLHGGAGASREQPAADADVDDLGGTVEDDPFHVGLVEHRHQLAGGDDLPVGQLAHPIEALLADEDLEEHAGLAGPGLAARRLGVGRLLRARPVPGPVARQALAAAACFVPGPAAPGPAPGRQRGGARRRS